MDHFPIVRSLARISLSNDDGPARHQVTRLAAALKKAGDSDSVALEKLLTSTQRPKELAPSRLTQSGTAARTVERLSRNAAVPVDRETSAPLASIIFPEENTASFPAFPRHVRDTVSALELEWEHHERIAAEGLTPSLSCLLYGQPGTGKTTLALWVAKTLELPAVIARLDGLISSFLGTTARNLGALFAFANRYECVLILDEFDAIAKLRDDPNEVGEIKRVVNALLQNIDLRAERGITFGLTNHSALLDPAVWRRFDVQLELPLPNTEQRLQIVSGLLHPESPAESAEAKLLAWVSAGISGAELQTMARRLLKRRITSANTDSSPVEVIGQIARSTSAQTSGERAGELIAESPNTLRRLVRSEEIRFSQAELAHLLGVSAKTVARRLAENESEELDNAS